MAGAARRRGRPPRARRPRAGAGVPADRWREAAAAHAPARAAGGRRGHRQDPQRGRVRPPRARPTARWCSTGASTRRRSRPISRSWRCCAAGRPASRSTRCAPALGARADELGILLPEFGAAGADGHAVGGAAADARRLRFFDAVAALIGEVAVRRRPWSCSRTCTGRTGRRCSSCATCSAPRGPAACSSSAPTARRSSTTSTRCTSWSATSAARGRSSGSSCGGLGEEEVARAGRRARRAGRPRPRSCTRCTGRRRATRSSSRRSSATCARRASGWAPRSRSPRRACPTACARSPPAGCAGWARTPPRWSWWAR